MNFIGHLTTVIRHRNAVIYHAFKAGILWRGLLHDLSKFSPTEFFAGAKYYTDGTRSPNEGERADFGHSKAWMHHKGRNRHHFEYWTDYNPETKVVSPVEMPLVFVKEMFCDRVAASKIYQGSNYTDKHPLEYYKRGTVKRPIHPETARVLEDLLYTLAEHGESAAFRKIRKMLMKRKPLPTIKNG